MLNSSKHLSDTELKHLESVLKRDIVSKPRNVLLFMLTLYTGARISEVLALTCGDYNIETKTLFIKGLKGSNDRELPLNAFLHTHLKAYMASLAPQGIISQDKAVHEVHKVKLFPISYSRAYQLWTEYRPCKKKIHALRHTRAIKSYKKTRNIHLVKTILGHKSITNTLVYLDYVESNAELKKALG